ncbi:MAG: FKBP-type peptidyl-prolyl cis-trans isomerase [Methanomassiliicoccaceae archaeon]|nr:FKBP-type peptidyl-prolyl cis-trans isomerase [Methanomassiliicoccaceae archaeon]
MADDADTPRKKGRDPILMIGTIVLAAAFLVVISGYAYGELFGSDSNEPARYGDAVRVDYVGSFYGWYDGHDGTDKGAVFDTSLWSVADNDGIWKSWGFTERKQEQYVPFSVTIGSGNALTEFETALIGMKPGETKWILIENGYGEVPAANVQTWTMTKTIQYTETMSAAEFRGTFDLANASPGIYSGLEHPYGWLSEAVFNSDGNVIVTHLVTDEIYEVNDNMTAEVVLLGATTFDIEFAFVDVVFTDTDGNIQLIEFKSGGETFYITNIDDVAGEFTTKSSREVVGMDLYFKITFVGY